MSKTPEQQAQEYYSKIDVLLASRETPKSLITTIFLAGHAAGKQDERERIARKITQHIVENGGATALDKLRSIIFGSEKV